MNSDTFSSLRIIYFSVNSKKIPALIVVLTIMLIVPVQLYSQRTAKPVLHGRHWVAITGKPLAATAGARIFHRAASPRS